MTDTEKTYQSILHHLSRVPVEHLQHIDAYLQRLVNEPSVHHDKDGTHKSAVFGSEKGKYILSPDFDEPLEDFTDYMS